MKMRIAGACGTGAPSIHAVSSGFVGGGAMD